MPTALLPEPRWHGNAPQLIDKPAAVLKT